MSTGLVLQLRQEHLILMIAMLATRTGKLAGPMQKSFGAVTSSSGAATQPAGFSTVMLAIRTGFAAGQARSKIGAVGTCNAAVLPPNHSTAALTSRNGGSAGPRRKEVGAACTSGWGAREDLQRANTTSSTEEVIYMSFMDRMISVRQASSTNSMDRMTGACLTIVMPAFRIGRLDGHRVSESGVACTKTGAALLR